MTVTLPEGPGFPVVVGLPPPVEPVGVDVLVPVGTLVAVGALVPVGTRVSVGVLVILIVGVPVPPPLYTGQEIPPGAPQL